MDHDVPWRDRPPLERAGLAVAYVVCGAATLLGVCVASGWDLFGLI